jgi:Chitobiase/beta-hexosaminidase C-terminal domain
MSSPHYRRLLRTAILRLVAGLLGLHTLIGIPPSYAAEANATPQRAVNPALARLLPLKDDVPREIKNPYFAKPEWKLWFKDPTPVIISAGARAGTYQPVKPEERKFPDTSQEIGLYSPKMIPGASLTESLAGCWDDCYMSLDNHHTRLNQMRGHFIDGGKMRMGRDVKSRFLLGVNFTSQSYSHRGRHIVDDMFNSLNTERHFFFANCVRATPAHISYRDNDPVQVQDDYDGLYSHSFQSVGQSGSEMHAVYKMMLAGACMPREVKNLLKTHGAYASALLTIYKASLPYTDAAGATVPYENELRHRPAYSASGDVSHPHFCVANPYYHGYNDKLHIHNMVEMAKQMEAAPPVALLKLLSVSVKKDGVAVLPTTPQDAPIKNICLTNTRIWGKPGETLDVRIDLNKSYDLQDKALTFTCKPLYPNQKNIQVKEEAPGVYLISVAHDPKLPKGRIPVICTARNDSLIPSNPVFVNFYWPEEKEVVDYPQGRLSKAAQERRKALGLRVRPVNVNPRPLPSATFRGDAIHCRPGETVTIDLSAKDPDGFPVTVYRRMDEPGTIDGTRFSMSIPQDAGTEAHALHFIFSDGTGGYSGRRYKVFVSAERDQIPDDWSVTGLGPIIPKSTVRRTNDIFAFSAQQTNPRARTQQGTFVYQVTQNDVDLLCRVPQFKKIVDLGISVRNTLEDFSPMALLKVRDGVATSLVRTGASNWTRGTFPQDKELATKPEYLRIVTRGDQVATYISSDGAHWEQAGLGSIAFKRQKFVGLVYAGRNAGAAAQWLKPTGAVLPIIAIKAAARKALTKASHASPVTISLVAPEPAQDYRYTVDGTEPTPKSTRYEEAFKLDTAGRHEVWVKSFPKDEVGASVIAAFTLDEPKAKKK